MHRREPIHCHIKQVALGEEGKDVHRRTVCEGVEDALWCLDECRVLSRCGELRIGDGRLNAELPATLDSDN